MKSRLIEFGLLNVSYWHDNFAMSLLNLRIDDWDRSLLYAGKDEDDWRIELFFIKLI